MKPIELPKADFGPEQAELIAVENKPNGPVIGYRIKSRKPKGREEAHMALLVCLGKRPGVTEPQWGFTYLDAPFSRPRFVRSSVRGCVEAALESKAEVAVWDSLGELLGLVPLPVARVIAIGEPKTTDYQIGDRVKFCDNSKQRKEGGHMPLEITEIGNNKLRLCKHFSFHPPVWFDKSEVYLVERNAVKFHPPGTFEPEPLPNGWKPKNTVAGKMTFGFSTPPQACPHDIWKVFQTGGIVDQLPPTERRKIEIRRAPCPECHTHHSEGNCPEDDDDS